MRKKKIRGFKRKIKGIAIQIDLEYSNMTNSQKLRADMYNFGIMVANEKGERIDPRNVVICPQ